MKRGYKKKKNDILDHNWGGHLPLPPNDCEKRAYIKTHDSIYWLDLSICHTCSKIQTCQRRKEYLTALKTKKETNHAKI